MNELFESLGFEPKESQVYLANFSLGIAPVSLIAKKSGLNRTNVYAILGTLVIKGYVRENLKGNMKYYEAIDPEELLSLFERKIRRFEKALPELRAMGRKDQESPKVRYYQWLEEVKQIYVQQYKDAPQEVRVFKAGIERKDEKQKLQEFRRDLKTKLRPKKVHILCNKTSSTLDEDKKTNTQRKTVPDSDLFLPASIKIYENKVHFISLRNKLFGVEIENEDIATCMRQIFDFCYKK